MADTEAKAAIDYKTVRVGQFADGFFDGMPTDAAKSWVLDKAGAPYRDPADPSAPHPLRAGLKHTHAGDEAKNIRRVSAPFPPKDFDKPLETAGDYLKALDAASAVPAKAEDAAPKAEAAPEGVTPTPTEQLPPVDGAQAG